MNRVFLLIFTTLTILMAGCNPDHIGPLYSGECGFSFPGVVLNVDVTDDMEGKIMVPICRSGKDLNMVNLSFETETTGLFTLVSKRTVFADNSYMAYAQVSISDIADLKPGKKYKFKLGISGSVTPGGSSVIEVTASRKLTFVNLGECTYFDHCLFSKEWPSVLQKAEEADIYRVISPYSFDRITPGLIDDDEFGTPPEYVEFSCSSDGVITFDPFPTGMKMGGRIMLYGYYPSTYVWGKDFSAYDSRNRKLSDSHYRLCAVFCFPDFSYGFINEGSYDVDIILK